MQEITNVENALEASVAKDKLHDILSSSADYTLEKLVDIGDAIPIISYFTKGLKATTAIRDFLFLEKVIEFLRAIGDEPTNARLKMVDAIKKDDKFSEKFGKVSIIAIERFNDIGKAQILGKTAKYLARNEITFSLYKRIAFIVDRLYLPDLIQFTTHDIKYLKKLDFVTDLEALGLVKTSYGKTLEIISGSGIGSRTTITDLGKVLKCIVLQKPLTEMKRISNFEQVTLEQIMRDIYP